MRLSIQTHNAIQPFNDFVGLITTNREECMRSLLMIVAAGLILTACECTEDPQPELTNTYLPLTIGNYWEFTGVGQHDLIEHREVEDYVSLNDRQYYVVVSTHLQDVWSGHRRDTAYYRIDQDGFVYVYKKSTGIEENRYRLNGKDGDTWSYDFVDDYVANMRLSELSKEVHNVEVQHCKDFSFDVVQWADEEYTYTLAPGVGFLKEFSDAWGGGQELKKARINGELIEF